MKFNSQMASAKASATEDIMFSQKEYGGTSL